MERAIHTQQRWQPAYLIADEILRHFYDRPLPSPSLPAGGVCGERLSSSLPVFFSLFFAQGEGEIVRSLILGPAKRGGRLSLLTLGGRIGGVSPECALSETPTSPGAMGGREEAS